MNMAITSALFDENTSDVGNWLDWCEHIIPRIVGLAMTGVVHALYIWWNYSSVEVGIRLILRTKID